MRRLVLFALVAIIPLACSSQDPASSNNKQGDTPAKSKQQGRIDAIVLDNPTTDEIPTEVKGTPTKSDWVPLFNGVDLTGWKTHPKSKGDWRVRNGALVGYGTKLNHLFTERDDFENVHLRVEAKISQGGNSGQFVRAKFEEGGGTLSTAYEANIAVSGGDLTGTLTKPNKGNKKKLHGPDEWFTQELIVNGYNIKIIVNGIEILDFTDEKKSASKGHIAIQDRPGGGGKGKKGGGGGFVDDADWTVMFKKIEVKELPKGR